MDATWWPPQGKQSHLARFTSPAQLRSFASTTDHRLGTYSVLHTHCELQQLLFQQSKSRWGIDLTTMPRILFVSGFHPATRARDLAYEFERYGPLVRCDVPAPRNPHANSNPRVASDLPRAQSHLVRELSAFVLRCRRRATPANGFICGPRSIVFFWRAIPFDRSMCAREPPSLNVPSSPLDPCRSYAFVEFRSQRDAEDAYYDMHGRSFEGSRLSIQWAKNPPSSVWRYDRRSPPRAVIVIVLVAPVVGVTETEEIVSVSVSAKEMSAIRREMVIGIGTGGGRARVLSAGEALALKDGIDFIAGMVSSLAAQLAQGASLNSSFLLDNARRKASESYLFSAQEARQHDLDSIHALGVNGFLQLKTLDPSLRSYDRVLFSDAGKAMDRTLQSADVVAELDRNLASFLPLLGPYLMDAPTGKVLEWVNEFNMKDVLKLFLPYHESPHFTKMVTILHIVDQSPFRFLLAHKSTAKPLYRSLLIKEMLRNTDLARFVADLLPAALREGGAGAHRTLIAFHIGTLLEFIAQSKTLDEGIIAFLLPAAMEPLQLAQDPESSVKSTVLQESILGSFLLLAALSQKCHFSAKALKAIVGTVLSCKDRVSPKHLVRTVISVCAPQDDIEKFSSSVVKEILKFRNVDDECKQGMAWVGAEKFLNPLTNGLISRLTDDGAVALLTSILTCSEVPSVVLRHAASKLLQLLMNDIAADSAESMVARRLLSQLHQRHLRVVQQICEDAVKDDDSRREIIEQLVLSLALPGTTSGDRQISDMIVASANADASIRVGAVRDLLKALASENVPVADVEPVKSVLRLCIHDTNSRVLHELYEVGQEQVVPILLQDGETYVISMRDILHGTNAKSSRDIVRLHLTFLDQYFFPAAYEQNAQLAARVIDQLVFPYLLFSKPKHKTTNMVWSILEAGEGNVDKMSIGRHELLGGCVDAVRWEQARHPTGTQKDSADSNVALLTKINMALASKISDNILASNSYLDHFEALLAKLHDANHFARNLSYLILRALLNRLSGEHRIDAAHRALEAMKLDSLEGMGDFMKDVDNLQTFLDDISVGTVVVLKPSSRNTLHRLQVTILAMLPTIPRPVGVTLEWLGDTHMIPADAIEANIRAAHYVQLLRSVYKLSNSSSSLPLLSTHLLRSLFIDLGDDALAFFAGVWLSSHSDGDMDEDWHNHIRHAALRHAASFLEAHCETEHWIDFQTVLPAVIIMLQSPDPHVRGGAVKCIAALVSLSHAKQASAVYAFDTIYGITTSKLQYIEWSDFHAYVSALASCRTHFLHDSDYLRKFHRQHLGQCKSEPKKEAVYKKRVICYLLSHVNACQLPDVKFALLKSLGAVSNEVKSHVLVPTMQSLFNEVTVDGQVALSNSLKRDIFTFLVSSFDSSAASELNDPNKPSWDMFENAVQLCFQNGISGQSFEGCPGAVYTERIISALTMERKSELCRLLIRIGTQEDPGVHECKSLLSHILTEVPLIIHLIVSLQPRSDSTAPPASKRARLDESTNETNNNDLASLTFLVEVLGSKSIFGSLELVSCLLETLSKVHHTHQEAADKRFLEQLLMIAMEKAIPAVQPTISSPGMVRLDTLVEIIRGNDPSAYNEAMVNMHSPASENAQTFHQALLLMASLARVAPDAVLHNVMPIFTFMGSNVFHRDDIYSFRVVQKTIDSIVPILVASLKGAHSPGLDLYIASRALLRVFTDASNHIPRHRRAKFFSHLVDVLGPQEFLPPVCMLLVDKVSNRAVRQSTPEARTSLLLPLTVIEHYSTEQQVSLLVELLQEVHRLVKQDSRVLAQSFLEEPPDDEQGHSVAPSKRRALALLIFCDHALRQLRTTAVARSDRERASSKELLSLLLDLAVLDANEMLNAEVVTAARSAMTSTLDVMSAVDFTAGVLTIVESGIPSAQGGALQLLGDRLTNVAKETRRKLTPCIMKMIEAVQKIISSGSSGVLISSTFHALAAISDTLCTGEEGSLTATTPFVLRAIREQAYTVPAIKALLSFSSRLGPRLIPYLKEIIQECVTVIRYAMDDRADDTVAVTSALSVLQSLLSTIPTFWSDSDLTKVIALYIDTFVSRSHVAMLPLVKTLAKRAPPNILLPTLSTMWSSLTNHRDKVRYIRPAEIDDGLVISLYGAAPRPMILEHLRELSKTFIDGFNFTAGICSKDIEISYIAAFLELVVKLNETAFRPLFRRLFDWAFTGSDSDVARKAIFCRIDAALLDYFKALMVPYTSFVWQPLVELLREYSEGSVQDHALWLSILDTLTKSLSFDEDKVFWRSDKLRQLVSPLVQQSAVCVRLNIVDGRDTLSQCLIATMEAIDDDALLKSMNLDILMHTRSEDSRLRLCSLVCSETLWRAHGDKLLGFVAETSTFIAECAEDDNDSVIREAHKLKAAVEGIAGSIDAL
ncbi:U3 small nucleolar RNA-associated protein 10 [Grifola frondosa]|uniref:U3 small nucleolar RNA-associated protein 10 n=1 Tax=Grifola frondosa TaxID=5627 RepID=A0A1C7MDE4_GRIFR|nr:U3 small nucleolar RNA-associated protein 10 [Grifola frondosa]